MGLVNLIEAGDARATRKSKRKDGKKVTDGEDIGSEVYKKAR